MLLVHRGRQPSIHPYAYVAPTAVICGDVSIGANTRVLFGAVLTAEGGPVNVGANCVIMENAVLRGSSRQPLTISDNVLIGPHSHLTGCTIEENVFLATGTSVFNGARVRTGSEVRINGVVHVNSVLSPDSVVPIGWVAVGDPARVLPPGDHDEIWAIQKDLNFGRTVFGLERAPTGETIMPELTRRYTKALGAHLQDEILNPK